jgi:competence protein ComEC
MQVRLPRWLAGIGAALWVATTLAAAPLPPPESGKLTVYFLDVGQGDAALIVSPTRKMILVDGGPPESAGSTVARLRSITSGPLDLIVLSHAHRDHLGGLPHVLEEVGAARFMDPGVDHSSSAYRDLLKRLGTLDVEYVEPSAPADGSLLSFGIGGGARIEILWPRQPLVPLLRGTSSDVNANSIVLRVSFGTTSFLFTGDMSSESEKALLGRGSPLASTILKVAHHGSGYSSQPAFLARVAARAAVISCGERNEYGHPHPTTLRHLDDSGAVILRTDELGDIRAVSDGTKVEIGAARSKVAVGTFRGAADRSAQAAPDSSPIPFPPGGTP